MGRYTCCAGALVIYAITHYLVAVVEGILHVLYFGAVPVEVVVEVRVGAAELLVLLLVGELLAVQTDEVAAELDPARALQNVGALGHAARLVAQTVPEDVLEVGEVVLDEPLHVAVL